MRTFITALLTLLLLAAGNNAGYARPPFPGRSDSIFNKAVERLREKVPGTYNNYPFNSPGDSVEFVKYFTALLDRELKTQFGRQHPGYAQCTLETPSFRLSIQQLLFRETVPPPASQIIRPVTKAPLELKFLRVKDRLIIFSYSPFEKNEARDKAIGIFGEIYRELAE